MARTRVSRKSKEDLIKKLSEQPVPPAAAPEPKQEKPAEVKATPPPPPPPPAPDPVPAKMKFRLLSGRHSMVVGADERGRTLRKYINCGDIVESDVDMAAEFKGKFVRVQAEEKAQRVSAAASQLASVLAQKAASEQDASRPAPMLRVVDRQGGRYDVIREDTGLPINDKFLSLAEAKDLESKSREAMSAAKIG